MRAYDVHAMLGRDGWVTVLMALGIDEAALKGRKNLPCPACGGRDRFTFDNRQGRGDFYCRQCGPGSGFDLLMRTHHWDFPTTFARVLEVARIDGSRLPATQVAAPRQVAAVHPSRPSSRLLALLRASCAVADCEPVVRYLESRSLWPPPSGSALRAHAAADYWHEGVRVGKYAAILAPVLDGDGVLASLHVTYLDASGAKLATYPARKLLGKLDGHEGCAVRLMPLDASSELGVAEGIETSLSAARLHNLPCWAAINTALLAKFDPPPDVHRIVIFADRDAGGLVAAIELRERLEGRCTVETRIPPAWANDWNDVLTRGES